MPIILTIEQALDIMWKGMLAIFIALGVICLFTIVLNKITNSKLFNRKK